MPRMLFIFFVAEMSAARRNDRPNRGTALRDQCAAHYRATSKPPSSISMTRETVPTMDAMASARKAAHHDPLAVDLDDLDRGRSVQCPEGLP